MSGGSYGYAYRHIEELADRIEQTTPLRTRFVEHLRKVAKAAHDIEWVDSADSSPGSEDSAIRFVVDCIHVRPGHNVGRFYEDESA